MFLVDWFYGILGFLGLGTKKANLLFLGLDNAGKTTLLSMLKDDRVTAAEPTLHPNTEELIIDKVHFKTFDLGGHEPARKLWEQYYAAADGIVFIVDAAERERFPESKGALDELLANEELANVPFVVLGNKIDVETAASEGELRAALGLTATYGKEVGAETKETGMRPIEVFMCSILSQSGYAEGFQWLAQFL
mmetsp:Transcript_180280/g.438703  ORF Transcript_180280/g.438703 Transcript_180280/m.438703 type:complete len:193 (+) Transcript_180280:217-795(+)